MSPEFTPRGFVFSNGEFEEALDSRGVFNPIERRKELVHMRRAWGIEKCRMDELIGLSAPEFFSRLPEYPWHIDNGARLFRVEIKNLVSVDYDTNKPRRETDWFDQVPVDMGRECLQKEFERQLEGKTFGLTSMVYVKGNRFSGQVFHLPTIDLDIKCPDFDLETVKRKIREKTEIRKGAFLSSGRSDHYHFVGFGRLLDQEDLITFLGSCLLIEEGIVDSRWVGHSLTPMAYHKQFIRDGSIYDYRNRFGTLRLTDSEVKCTIPKIVDVM